jgi:hypothetical protein
MSSLSYVDKERMANFFGIKGGYIFSFLKSGYNKTNTRNIILEACGIDIYKNQDYDMSQERCIRKIWDEKDDGTIGNLLRVMLDYYDSISDWEWDYKEQQDYHYLRELQEKLMSGKTVILPSTEGDETLAILMKDIEQNLLKNTPELALDRLHTFACKYIREVCEKHDVKIADDKGNNLSLDTITAKLKKLYDDNQYFESEFCTVAIRNTINIFAKFNDIRNNKSFAHPNPVLEKIEAEYVVRIVSETLAFIDKIEETKALHEKELFDISDLFADGQDASVDDDKLPF